MGSDTTGEAPVKASELKVANSSNIGTMLWIGFYTTLLNIFTLTIFRFWGRTHFRRAIVDGHNNQRRAPGIHRPRL